MCIYVVFITSFHLFYFLYRNNFLKIVSKTNKYIVSYAFKYRKKEFGEEWSEEDENIERFAYSSSIKKDSLNWGYIPYIFKKIIW